jgi:hypothetical protein
MKLASCLLLAGLAGVPALAQDPCAGASSTVDIAELTVAEDGALTGKGTWSVGGGADGAVLEYRVDGDRLLIESRTGASGTWDIARVLPFDNTCGRHTFVVFALPSVKAGGRQIHCMKKGSSPRTYEISCAPVAEIVDCAWHCSGEDSLCTGDCTARARRGRLGYVPYWGVNGDAWEPGGPSSEGPWTHHVDCAPGERISFKVRDRDGKGFWSEVDEIGCGVTE